MGHSLVKMVRTSESVLDCVMAALPSSRPHPTLNAENEYSGDT